MATKKIYSIDHNCPHCEETFELKYLELDNTIFTMSTCPDCDFPILLTKQTKRDMEALLEKSQRLLGNKL